jgi:myo-inositol-1(or 4)-monophosphatase
MAIKKITPKEALVVAIKATRLAGDIMNKYSSREYAIKNKAPKDLVTEVDIKCEQVIKEAIYEVFPDHGVLAEEGGGRNMEKLCRWIVDPIDGTTNFAHGFPMFCSSVAYEEEGQVVAGAIYDPVRDELFTATLGGGSYLNSRPIVVSSTNRLAESLLATGFPYTITTEKINNIREFADMSMEAQAVRRPGAAALDLCYVACGRLDGFWEFHLQPWDVAAGVLIVQEAGGAVTDDKRQPINIYLRKIVASNNKIHEEMLQVLGRA